jgi:hypothetical protein
MRPYPCMLAHAHACACLVRLGAVIGEERPGFSNDRTDSQGVCAR